MQRNISKSSAPNSHANLSVLNLVHIKRDYIRIRGAIMENCGGKSQQDLNKNEPGGLGLNWYKVPESCSE